MHRALLAAFAAALACAPAAHAGTVEEYEYASATGTVHYRVFTPAGYDAARPVPLVVFTHGCNTTAAQQEAASAYDPVAEREGFVVMYPDDDDSNHPLQCWRFYDGAGNHRDAGDVATIAGMTRAVMKQRSIDPERVYEVAMSSGALITSDLAAAYPDLYAAIGLMAGSPYGSPDACLSGLHGAPAGGDPAQLATAALAEMGKRARVVPVIVLHGDQDNTVSPACGDQAAQQWLRTANLILGGEQETPLALAPAATRSATVPGGHPYDVRTYRQPSGCVIAEHWVIHGMDHFWSGGTSDPVYAAFTDPGGPSAAEASWAFFSRFTRSGTGEPCAETPVVPRIALSGARRCTKRSARLRIAVTPAPAIDSVSVSLDGRALKTTSAAGFTVKVPFARRGRLSIVATSRTADRTVRRLAVVRCGRAGQRFRSLP